MTKLESSDGRRRLATAAPRVVVIDSQVKRRRELVSLLESDGGIVVAGQGGAAQAVSLLLTLKPDAAIVDLSSSPAALAWIRLAIAESSKSTSTSTPILALTDGLDRSHRIEGVTEIVARPPRWDTTSTAMLKRRIHRLAFEPPRPGVGSRLGSPVVGLAASTGGPSALATVLGGLRGLEAPVLVVQHLHPEFVDGFITWMQATCGLPVELAIDGIRPAIGTIYVAAPNLHLKLAGQRLRLAPGPQAVHRPSADVLFESLATEAGSGAVGVLMTGMGADGAAGLLALRSAGGHAIVQDEATSAIFGMPQAAQRLDAVDQMLPLGRIAEAVLEAVRARGR